MEQPQRDNSSGDSGTGIKKTQDDIQKSSKKKFSRTVFAEKMRNKRKEDKLKTLDVGEVLTTCKSVSVDLTRLVSDAVPKLIKSTVHKNRKRRRSQWKLGLVKKKKKTSDKKNVATEVKPNNDTDIGTQVNNDEKHDGESNHTSTEVFSCRRIEPFIGKLNTKAARTLYIEQFLKEGTQLVPDNSKKVSPEKDKKDDESITTQPVSENEKKSEDNIIEKSNVEKFHKVEESRIDNEPKGSDGKMTDSEKKRTTRSCKETIKEFHELERELINVDSKKKPKTATQFRENNLIEEVSCRRILPFTGKTPQKPIKADMPENIVEIDSASEISSKPDSEDKNIQPSALLESSANLDSFCNKMNINKNSSLDESSIKLDIQQNIADAELSSAKQEPSDNFSVEMDSAKRIETNSLLAVKDNEKLHSTLNDTGIKKLTPSKILIKLGGSIRDDKSKFTTSSRGFESDISVGNCNKNEIWSCQRTQPYVPINHPNCSRTLPYVPPVDKVKSVAPKVDLDFNNDPECLLAGIVIPRIESSDADQLIQQLRKHESSVTPINTEKQLTDLQTNEISCQSTDSKLEIPVQNGEWKFKRKRQKVRSNDEIEQARSFKKSKAKPSNTESTDELTVDGRTDAPPSSPGGTICSMFSSKCIKHDHHSHISQSIICQKSKQNLRILLTKLEHNKNPLVIKYMKGTNTICENKIISLPPIENKSDSNESSEKLNNELQEVSQTDKEVKQAAKDDLIENVSQVNTVPVVESNSSDVKTNAENVQDDINQPIDIKNSISKSDEFKVVSTEARKRNNSRSSSESPILLPGRKKRPNIDYSEDSDSEITENFFYNVGRRRQRPQSRGPILRDRNKLKMYVPDDEDEDDMEVEEFSRLGQSRLTDETNQDEDRDVPYYMTRAKSRGPLIDVQRSSLNETPSISTELKTLTLPESNKQNQRISLDKHDQQHQEGDTERDKEIANSPRPCSCSQNLSSDPTKTIPLPSSIESKLNSSTLPWSPSRTSVTKTVSVPSTPKATFKSILPGSASIVLERKSQALEIDENEMPNKRNWTPISMKEDASLISNKSASPKMSNDVSVDLMNQLATPSKASGRSAVKDVPLGDLNCTSSNQNVETTLISNQSTPSKSAKHVAVNLLGQLLTTPSKASAEPVVKDIPLRDLKVQLIRLETVCERFDEYSASEIELLTRKYIDLLMNSNFTCDTWRKPINYHQSSDQFPVPTQDIDNSDCISTDIEIQDAEKQTDEVPSAKQVIEDPIAIHAVEPIALVNAETSKTTTPRKTTSQQDEMPSKSTIPTLDNQEPQENTSETVNESVNTDSVDTDILPQKNHRADEAPKSPETIVVNGNTMFVCSICTKIFVNRDSLNMHNKNAHKIDCETVSDRRGSSGSNSVSSTTTSKPRRKSFDDPKKIKKPKKRMKCSENSKKCSVCSKEFESKELLFEHIYQHNEQELQQAYAKNKADKEGVEIISEELNNEKQTSDEKTAEKIHQRNTSSDSRTSIEIEPSNQDPLDSSAVITQNPPTASIDQEPQEQQTIDPANELETVEPVPVNVPCETRFTICPCHVHESNRNNNDLHIEMVLLCKSCNCIFRRRDCFEMHFRTVGECRRKRANGVVTKEPKLFCNGCPCILGSLMDMRSHLEMHAKQNCQGTVIFLCNICKVAFFGVGSIFYQHWYNHAKAPNFVASRYSFPKMSVVSVLEDSNAVVSSSMGQEGFFYIAEFVCRECRLPFSSEPELQKHKLQPCQPRSTSSRIENTDSSQQMVKIVCDLCKKYYVSKENFDRHCGERNHLKTPITKFSRVAVSPTEQAFVCSLCRSVSKTLDDMKEHWKRIHSPFMELYTCKTCNVVPSSYPANYTYEKFEKHCRQYHKSEVITCLVYFVTSRYTCEICKFGFESSKSLKEHKVAHEKNEQTLNPADLMQQTMTVSNNLNVPLDSQTATLWSPDQNIAPDGGRTIQPVHMHYQGTDKVTNPINPNSITTMNPSLQRPQMQVSNENQTNISSTSILKSNVSKNIESRAKSVSKNTTSMLRGISSLTMDPQQQTSAESQAVEMITLDSRSNSPVSNAMVSIDDVNKITADNESTTNTSGKSKTLVNVIADALGTTPKKSYMTMVNPDFESIMGEDNAGQSNEKAKDKQDTNSTDKDTPSITTGTSTPEPFEVVLLNDDLSDNCNGETLEKNVVNNSISSPLNQTKECSDSSSTKSFLRVRSIAELQGIKIDLCSICGQSFDSSKAYQLHMEMHESDSLQQKVADNTAPVQMISPMITPSSSRNFVANNQPTLICNETMPDDFASPSNTGASASKELPSQHQVKYWFPGDKSANQSRTHPNRAQSSIHHRRSVINSNFVDPRGAPPPYPNNIPTLVPLRPSAIQLPERSTATPNVTKRPSGAATRIPQQSLPPFQELTTHRQEIRNAYNMAEGRNSPQPMTNQVNRHTSHGQKQQSFLAEQLMRSKTVNYSSPINSSSSCQQPQYTQQLHQSGKMIFCKVPGCTYRSSDPYVLKTHEQSHQPVSRRSPIGNQYTSMQNIHQAQPQQGQMQQHRLPIQHVPMGQTSHRSRLSMVNNRNQSHSMTLTNALKNFICSICNISYSTNVELIQHMNIHNNSSNLTGLTPCCFVCDYCPTPLLMESEFALREHMEICHNHVCTICQSRYPSKQDLLIHMKSHAGNT